MTIHGMHVLAPELGGCSAPVGHFRIWDSGCTWRHIHVAPGTFDWARFDYVVQQAQLNGATNLTYVVSATPQWLAADPNLPNYAPWLGPGSNSKPWDMSHFTQFLDQLASRTIGVVGSFEIWNEPQLKDFWGYDGWAVLANMTDLAYTTIKAVNPSAKIVSGAVLPRASSGGMTRGGKYLLALKAKGWPVDIYAAHMYPEIGHTPGQWRDYAEAWQAKLSEVSAPVKPKWVTETNMNLNPLGTVGVNPLSDAAIIDYMNRIDDICNDEDIFKCYWYAWQHGSPSLLGIPFTPTTQGTATLTDLLEANS